MSGSQESAVFVMTLPFDTQQFLAVFAVYNLAIWPAQVAAYVLAFVMLGGLFLRSPLRERVILGGLSIMWAWNGLVYHLSFFSRINPAAYGFAVLFALQAALLAFHAFKPNEIRFGAQSRWQRIVAFILIAYALLIYEALGVMAGHGLLKGPLFGVAPCPTTILTIGLLLLGGGRLVGRLATIPLLWALVGTSAAVLLSIPEDFGLGVAGTMFAVSQVVAAVADGSGARQSHEVIDQS